MSREPTAEQIEAVAQELHAAGPWGAPSEFVLPHHMRAYRGMARVAIAAMNAETQQATRMERQRVLVGNSVYEGAQLTWTPRHLFIEFDTDDLDDVTVELAEPLTSTPKPSTTETRTEGPINQGPPPGFKYEYREVTNPSRPESSATSWTSESGHQHNLKWSRIEGWDYPDKRGHLERRLVGPPERIEEE